MTNTDSNVDIRQIIKNVWDVKPVVQCITNFVTVNDCANIILAIGGSPTMAHDIREAADIASGCQAVVLNMGNVQDTEAMISAGKMSNQLGNPVVMDPVGVGGSPLRRETFKRLADHVHFTVLRGNASEIKYIATGINHGTSVDAAEEDAISEQNTNYFVKLAKVVAREYQCVVCISGKLDIIADQENAYVIRNGHEIMSRVTGTGCMSTALIAAVCGGNKEHILEAVVAAVVIMDTSGEKAFEKMKQQDGGTMTFRTHLIDSISKANEKTTQDFILERANYDKI